MNERGIVSSWGTPVLCANRYWPGNTSSQSGLEGTTTGWTPSPEAGPGVSIAVSSTTAGALEVLWLPTRDVFSLPVPAPPDDVAAAPASAEVSASPLPSSTAGASSAGASDAGDAASPEAPSEATSSVATGSVPAPSANAISELPCPSANANRSRNDTNEARPRLLARPPRGSVLLPILDP